MRAWVLVLASCPFLHAVAHAAAQDLPETVLVDIESCAGSELDVARLTEDIRIELTSDGIRDVRPRSASIELTDAADGAVALITIAGIACEVASASFVVRIDDRITSKEVERTVDLDDVSEVLRARALALAVAELMRASWAELAMHEPAPSAPIAIVRATLARARVRASREARDLGVPVAEPPRSAVAETAPRSTAAFTVAFLVRSFPVSGAAPLGARAGLDLRLLPELALGLHAEVGVGTASHFLGTIELGLATAGAGLAYVAAIGDVHLMIGAAASAGAAWTRGQPLDRSVIAGSGAGAIVSVTAGLELEVPLHDHVALRLGIDVGGVPLGFEARVASVPVSGITGASIGGWAGLALFP